MLPKFERLIIIQNLLLKITLVIPAPVALKEINKETSNMRTQQQQKSYWIFCAPKIFYKHFHVFFYKRNSTGRFIYSIYYCLCFFCFSFFEEYIFVFFIFVYFAFSLSVYYVLLFFNLTKYV